MPSNPRLPLLAWPDVHTLARYLPFAKLAELRAVMSGLIASSIMGLPIKRAKSIHTGTTLQKHRDSLSRAGVFDRLHADGVFTQYVDWKNLESGRNATASPFFVHPRLRVIDAFQDVVENERDERRRLLASSGAGSGIGVREANSVELRNLSKRGRRLVRSVGRRVSVTSGADAIAELGDDLYVECIDALSADLYARCLRLCRLSPTPQHRLDAWMSVHHLPRASLLAVPPSWIEHGATWTVYSAEAMRIDDTVLIADIELPIDLLDRVPADDTIKLPKVMSVMSEVVPF